MQNNATVCDERPSFPKVQSSHMTMLDDTEQRTRSRSFHGYFLASGFNPSANLRQCRPSFVLFQLPYPSLRESKNMTEVASKLLKVITDQDTSRFGLAEDSWRHTAWLMVAESCLWWSGHITVWFSWRRLKTYNMADG